MKTLLTLVFVLALATGAYAQNTFCYGWENGGDILGCWNCDNATYVNDGTHVSEGTSALQVSDLGGSTPQLYVAWVVGLQEGDEVTVTCDAWDDSQGTNPSVRIWGHWTDDVDINNYVSSPGIGSGYSGDTEWVNLSSTWAIPAGIVALCVEIRPYDSSPYGGLNWVDNVCVTAPAGTHIYFPGGVVENDGQDATWGSVKAMFK